MEELKPCPFCGSETEVCEGGINGKMRVYGLVEHKDGCFFLADGLTVKYQHVMESEFAAWNTRAERTCKNVSSRQTPWKCSACGGEWFHGWNFEPLEFRYCPDCGAKVVGECES